ncbi:hypothetical protein [Atopomonas hussainii]|uniref:hypothetical protein n=1 Tax=Atopomonas hussainii TaxID=1429083 RepID=UPI000900234C|nr:hypothetical protein [Atopomonas hussainii]
MTELIPLHALNVKLLMQEPRFKAQPAAIEEHQPSWKSRWQQLRQLHVSQEQPRLSPFYRA